MSVVYQPLLQSNSSTNIPDNGIKAYEYNNLKEGQIRLLRLDGVHNVADAGENAPLICEVIVSTLVNDDLESMSSNRSEASDDGIFPKDVEESLHTEQADDVDIPQYDALSYVWGGAEPRAKEGRESRLLFLSNPGGRLSYLSISVNLEAALKSFRREVFPQGRKRELFLWVDAVCINQADRAERSTQIRRMAAIYKEANLVRIWLGGESKESKVAFDFIRHILSMEDFDKIIEDTVTGPEWDAFRSLLQMPWFKRRWIVQEVAFAKNASVYCGKSTISWRKLAASISLFVDARYELRRMFRNSSVTENNPDYLGEVNSYSAKTLVDCISGMFRRSGDESIMKNLLSLESLLTTLTPFEARDPHDAVYAIILMSNDAKPTSDKSMSKKAEDGNKTNSQVFAQATSCGKQRERSPEYTISGRQRTLSPEPIHPEANQAPVNVQTPKLPPTPPEERRGRSFQVGRLVPGAELSRSRSRARSPSPGAARAAAERRAESPPSKKGKKFVVDYEQSVFRLCIEVMNWIVQQSRSIDIICKPWVPEITPALECEFYRIHNEDLITLPSWIQSLRKRTYGLDPVSNNKRYIRIAADSLVGSDSFGKKPYSACADLPLPRNYRPPNLIQERHFRTRGFVLDTVDEVADKALNGIIPNGWPSLAGWETTNEDPPEAFWRTLVANRRSIHGPQQPPHHWPDACRWAFRRKTDLGDLNTEHLINNVYGVPSRRTLFFLERMRAVVWNRKLIKTQGFVDEDVDHGSSWGPVLGLAPEDVREGDKIVILYGCSVPVVLRPNNLSKKKVSRQGTQEIWKLSKKNRRATDEVVPYRTRSFPLASIPSVAINGMTMNPGAPDTTAPSPSSPQVDGPEVTYTLVGECYMHAFMDGEAFERNGKSARDEDFILGCAQRCSCPACARQ